MPTRRSEPTPIAPRPRHMRSDMWLGTASLPAAPPTRREQPPNLSCGAALTSCRPGRSGRNVSRPCSTGWLDRGKEARRTETPSGRSRRRRGPPHWHGRVRRRQPLRSDHGCRHRVSTARHRLHPPSRRRRPAGAACAGANRIALRDIPSAVRSRACSGAVDGDDNRAHCDAGPAVRRIQHAARTGPVPADGRHRPPSRSHRGAERGLAARRLHVVGDRAVARRLHVGRPGPLDQGRRGSGHPAAARPLLHAWVGSTGWARTTSTCRTKRREYGTWVGNACAHLWSIGVRHVELWNEQNLSGFFQPLRSDADRDTYIAMAKDAATKCKAATPGMFVLAGGFSTSDTIFQRHGGSPNGALQHDGLLRRPWPVRVRGRAGVASLPRRLPARRGRRELAPVGARSHRRGPRHPRQRCAGYGTCKCGTPSRRHRVRR